MQSNIFKITLILAFFIFSIQSWAQPIWAIKLLDTMDKPEKYENRKLGSEKDIDKKFNFFRRLKSNTTTHYNFYYNAHRINNSVLERASKTDNVDYNKTLPFYPYSLNSTKVFSNDLDSVIVKANEGILLHDLRSNWVDNMYMEMGKAYYYKKDFDTAAGVFQFIISNLYPKQKKNEDEIRYIGSNENINPSIASKEKRNVLQKTFTLPHSRNDAYIWLIKTLNEQANYGQSKSLIDILITDASFPKRLIPELNEEIAHFYYKQNNFDSTVVYLERAMSAAPNKVIKNWWQFLLAQLFDQLGNADKAQDYFSKAIKSALDPEMEIYARVYNTKAKGLKNKAEWLATVSELESMAKKDKYFGYDDLVYLAAGELALSAGDVNRAIINFDKATKTEESASGKKYKNKAIYNLEELYFANKKYILTNNQFDSLGTEINNFDSLTVDKLQKRKAILTNLVPKLKIIQREDSLQKIANMQKDDRDNFIKALVRKARKAKGLKDDIANNSNTTNVLMQNNTNNIFSAPDTKKGWYFDNENSKSKGQVDFKNKWGDRVNLDNWRRSSSLKKASSKSPDKKDNGLINTSNGKDNNSNETYTEPKDITFEAYMANVPLTDDDMLRSKGLVCFQLDEILPYYFNELNDFENTIETGKTILNNCNNSDPGKICLQISDAYTSLGNYPEASRNKSLAFEKYSKSSSIKNLLNPTSNNNKNKNPEATESYNKIFTAFDNGETSNALNLKKQFDTKFGETYWTPQLLYIEAAINAKLEKDAEALSILENLGKLYPSNAILTKANALKLALEKRKYINEQNNIVKATKDIPKNINPTIPSIVDKPKDIKVVDITVKKEVKAKDTIAKAPVVKTVKPISKLFKEDKGLHSVIVYFPNLDKVYVKEVKVNINRFHREQLPNESYTMNQLDYNSKEQIIAVNSFIKPENTKDYITKLTKFMQDDLIWLPRENYKIVIVNQKNLEIILKDKKIQEYIDWAKETYPF